MTAVECSSKSGPYCRQVCAGTLANEPPTAPSTSLGLRTTCTIQFAAAHTTTTTTVATMIWTAGEAAERRAPRLRTRVGRRPARANIAWGMTDTASIIGRNGARRRPAPAELDHIVR